jgi:hypothetical protein
MSERNLIAVAIERSFQTLQRHRHGKSLIHDALRRFAEGVVDVTQGKVDTLFTPISELAWSSGIEDPHQWMAITLQTTAKAQIPGYRFRIGYLKLDAEYGFPIQATQMNLLLKSAREKDHFDTLNEVDELDAWLIRAVTDHSIAERLNWVLEGMEIKSPEKPSETPVSLKLVDVSPHRLPVEFFEALDALGGISLALYHEQEPHRARFVVKDTLENKVIAVGPWKGPDLDVDLTKEPVWVFTRC